MVVVAPLVMSVQSSEKGNCCSVPMSIHLVTGIVNLMPMS